MLSAKLTLRNINIGSFFLMNLKNGKVTLDLWTQIIMNKTDTNQ